MSYHNFRQFKVDPKEGLVESITGAKPWKNSQGCYYITDKKGKKHLVSHIVYAYSNYKSLKEMKNYIVKYKDGDKSNNKINNLTANLKNKILKEIKKNKRKFAYYSFLYLFLFNNTLLFLTTDFFKSIFMKSLYI